MVLNFAKVQSIMKKYKILAEIHLQLRIWDSGRFIYRVLSPVNMVYTLLIKRNLLWFLQNGKVHQRISISLILLELRGSRSRARDLAILIFYSSCFLTKKGEMESEDGVIEDSTLSLKAKKGEIVKYVF
ncbi:glutamyl-tRNA synthetase [Striga asiatica]|uniref:Glutamyl-tRNA synthetase n=1 Tax=Striga asiatica TaxID=4170 RepID=A0A5A7PVG8_STRAF|nr:glutamyl-tRNA synthetase [Striga asiatica]